MKLIEYIALIGAVCAAFTLQPAKADTFTSSLDFGNSAISGFLPAGEQFGTVTVTLIAGGAQITFQANTASGFFFIDTNAAAVNLAQPPGSPTIISDPDFDHFNNPPNTDQVDGIGTFNLRVENKSGSVLVSTII